MTDGDADAESDDSDPDEDPYVGRITQKAILFGPDDRVLVTRVDDHWEVPGGTFEYGETLVGGLRRELREELSVDARVGAPVEALYGGWIDGDTLDPMVALLYRCVTDETVVELDHEHDDYEWVAPETAVDRLGETAGGRIGRAVERAARLHEAGHFEARADPYEDSATTAEWMLAELAEYRTREPED